jgi:hypothetical protein
MEKGKKERWDRVTGEKKMGTKKEGGSVLDFL